MQINQEIIKNAFLKKGYKLDPIINIVGIRANLDVPNAYNDFIGIVSPSKGICEFYEATTDPGVFWLEKPMNVKGTSILIPNQYVNCWTIGYHGSGVNRHEALVQIRNVNVWRDNNKNSTIEINPLIRDAGIFGINIHSTGILSFVPNHVDKFSAGCQVIRRYDTFKNKFIPLVKASGYKQFTYTLLKESDL